MGFEFKELEEAKASAGMRMIVVSGVPSPWSEAAKGIFYIKNIDWIAVRHDARSQAQQEWALADNAPVALLNDEKPRTGWSEILFLAERVGIAPSLIPCDPKLRACFFGLAHELMGEQGLCWSRRLQMIDMGLHGEGAARKFAEYRAQKYGHSQAAIEHIEERIVGLLKLFSSQMASQRAAGSDYLVGKSVSALDIYSAASMALLSPLPNDLCSMEPLWRAAFSALSEKVHRALDPGLLEHRDMMYSEHLVTPLAL